MIDLNSCFQNQNSYIRRRHSYRYFVGALSVVRLGALNRALLINSPLEQNNAFAQRLRFSQLNFNRDVASPQAPGGLVQKVCTSPEFGNACYPQVVVCRVGHISGTLDTSLLYDTNSRCCCGKGAWGSRFEFER